MHYRKRDLKRLLDVLLLLWSRQVQKRLYNCLDRGGNGVVISKGLLVY